MRGAVTKAVCVKNIVAWAVIGFCCIVALVTFVRKFAFSLAAGIEIFIPGVLVLSLAVAALLVFSVTRVIKYVNLLRGIG